MQIVGFKGPFIYVKNQLNPSDFFHLKIEIKRTTFINDTFCLLSKGQLISKANCQAVNSSLKQMNEFVFTTMRRVFVCFLEEIEDTKKTF